MRVGIALKLQEAWKAKFETRPSASSQAVSFRSLLKEEQDQSSDDGTGSTTPPNLNEKVALTTSLGYRDECITVDARKDKKGQWVLVKGDELFDVKQDAKKQKKPESILDPYCVVITRRFSPDGKLQETVAEIQSPGLIQLLRSIVKFWPDNTFRVGGTIQCMDPPMLLYHHRKELSDHREAFQTSKHMKVQIKYLLGFLDTLLGDDIADYESLLSIGMVRFVHLQLLYKPGTLVYEHEMRQLYFFEKGNYANTPCGPTFVMECHYVDYDGEKLGKTKRTLIIKGFDNPRDINTLRVRPLERCPDAEDIKSTLKERARRFLQLRGIHNLQHKSKGRVMVDAKTCLRRILPGNDEIPDSQKKGIVVYEECKCRCAVCRKTVEEKVEDYDHKVREIKDDELLLCSSMVLGFTLGSHKWTGMKVDDLSEITWSADAIDRLVLDVRQKKVLSSLVRSPVFMEGVEGDVIGWKGKGLVMLLHGAPGTGKTLTAESVTESLKRPLFIVSGGELGVTPQEVEKSLEEILELSMLWKAVILIDEADVFLEERSAHDIVRNNFVAVFLRRLEYFEGILMLTTNRVEQFDSAFISRIHLALSYPELEPWMRKEIWTNALKRLFPDQLAIDLDKDLGEISEVPLNGRAISYAVRTAKAIADDDKSKLTTQHLWDVISVHQKFNEHLRQRKLTEG